MRTYPHATFLLSTRHKFVPYIKWQKSQVTEKINEWDCFGNVNTREENEKIQANWTLEKHFVKNYTGTYVFNFFKDL